MTSIKGQRPKITSDKTIPFAARLGLISASVHINRLIKSYLSVQIQVSDYQIILPEGKQTHEKRQKQGNLTLPKNICHEHHHYPQYELQHFAFIRRPIIAQAVLYTTITLHNQLLLE